MNKSRWFIKILITLRKHLKGQRLIIFLSILSGIFAGLAALVIKNLVLITKSALTGLSSGPYQHFLIPILPAIGLLGTILFSHFILKKKVGHGIPMTLFAISKNKGKIHPHNMFSSIITSSLTVGFGGSAGLEGPSVGTGAAWGSNIGKLFGVSHRKMILLIACSSAGAMAAIFKAPVAGIVFVLEVLMLELTMASIIPLLLAALSGALVSFLLVGMDVVVPVDIQRGFLVNEVPFFLLFGVLAGFISAWFTKVFKGVEQYFDKIKNRYSKWLIGSFCLGVILFFFPSIYGEGFEAINAALEGDYKFVFDGAFLDGISDNIYMAFILLTAILFLKIVATSVTFGSGGVGGIFAPSLYIGALFGLLFVLVLSYFDIYELPVDHFVLAGMGGLIAGVLHAPLTGIFLIAELTGGYDLIFPLMITATISYAISRKMEPSSAYTYQLRRRGELFTHDKDQVVLSLLNVRNLIETEFTTINKDAHLGDLVDAVTRSKRNIFPVVDNEGNLHGMVYLNDIRGLLFEMDMYHQITVKELMHPAEDIIAIDQPMQQVAQKFQETTYYNLPVLDGKKYVGFVSRANVFSAYRKMLRDMSDE